MWPFTPKNPSPEVIERWIDKRKFRKVGRILARSDDAALCRTAIEKLGPVVRELKDGDLTGYWSGVDALEAATRSADDGVRLAAVDQLAAIRDAYAAVHLHSLIDDPSEAVAARAVQAVCSQRHYGSMIASLSSSNEAGRNAIVEALIETLERDARYVHTLDCWLAGRPAPDGRERPTSVTFDDGNLPFVKQDAEMSLLHAIRATMANLMDAKADVGLKIGKAFTEDPIKSFVRGSGADAQGSEPTRADR